jgi:hypothetical protein
LAVRARLRAILRKDEQMRAHMSPPLALVKLVKLIDLKSI